MATDAELAERAKRGDDTAIELLFRRYQDRLFSYLFRMLANRAAAEDALQETFVNAIRALPRYKEQGHFKSWLYRIAHREALQALKKRKRSLKQSAPSGGSGTDFEDELEKEIPDSRPSASEQMLEKEQQQQLELAIAALPEDEKQVVLLRMNEGLSFKEIAEVMNCPLNTALGRMHNATKKLKAALIEKGILE